MDLRQRLKEETKNLHRNIEQTFLFKKIMQQEMTLNDYHLLIQKFYGFIRPCEDSIDSLSCKSIIENRKKTSWLEQDLRALNILTKEDETFARCHDLPVLFNHEHVLGYLYVMEGSTLGGQIISKMLKSQLDITHDKGGRFFLGYGDETKQKWDEFCLLLSTINNTQQQNTIIYSAKNTFNQLCKWMKTRSSL